MPSPPSIVKLPPKLPSTEPIVTASFPVPASIVNELEGVGKSTLSLNVDPILMFWPGRSVSVIDSPPPVNVKTRSAVFVLSVTGSNPV